MTLFLRRVFLALALLFVCATWVPDAFAQSTTPPPATPTTSATASLCAGGSTTKSGVLLGYIMPCMERTISASVTNMANQTMDMMQPAMIAFITLAVVLFGVKILTGAGQEIHKEGFVFLLKIAFVIGLIGLIPRLPPVLFGAMQSMQEIVSSAVGTEGMKCDVAHYIDGDTPLLWAQMDCLIGKLYGFTTGTDPVTGADTGTNMVLGASIFGLMAGFFFGGTLGFTLFLVLMGVLWSILKLVLKVALAVVNSYFLVGLMLILAPLFLPLMLVRATGQFFESWWKQLMAGMLFPAIVTAYSIFGMLLYDALLFRDDSQFNKPFNPELTRMAQHLPQAPCDGSQTGLSNFREMFGDANRPPDANTPRNPVMSSMVNPLISGANNICAAAQLPVFRLEEIPGFENPQASFTALFIEGVKLLIMAILIEEGLATVLGMTRLLVGGATSLSRSLSATTPAELAMTERLEQAKQGAMQGLNGNAGGMGATGATLIGNIPRSISGALQGLTGRRE